MELLSLALKNVFRNRRRSLLNIIALALATALMILGLGWVEGYHTYIYKAMQDFESGDLQMVPENYLREQRRFPLDLALDDYSSLKAQLKSYPEIREATGRIDFSLRLSNRKESVWLAGRGIDPESEGNTTVLSGFIDQGNYLSSNSRGILLGKELAERMDVSPGDTLYIVARDRYGAENFVDIRVSGIFHYGFPQIDKNVVFLDLESAMELLDMDNRVSRIVMRLSPGVSINRGVDILNGRDLPGEIYGWKTFAQATVSAVEADSGSFYMILTILYILIVLGILNSMSMSVHERTREIGTLRAIGMKRGYLTSMLLAESAWLALIAAAFALILSIPMIWYLGTVGLDISSQMPEEIPVPFGEMFYADFKLHHFLVTMAVTSLAAFAGTLRPAFKAAKLTVADSMRGGGLG